MMGSPVTRGMARAPNTEEAGKTRPREGWRPCADPSLHSPGLSPLHKTPLKPPSLVFPSSLESTRQNCSQLVAQHSPNTHEAVGSTPNNP